MENSTSTPIRKIFATGVAAIAIAAALPLFGSTIFPALSQPAFASGQDDNCGKYCGDRNDDSAQNDDNSESASDDNGSDDNDSHDDAGHDSDQDNSSHDGDEGHDGGHEGQDD